MECHINAMRVLTFFGSIGIRKGYLVRLMLRYLECNQSLNSVILESGELSLLTCMRIQLFRKVFEVIVGLG